MSTDSATRSSTDYLSKLYLLIFYLSRLPAALPNPESPKIDLRDFKPNFQKYEGDEAINRGLEVALGPRTGPRETFVILERGPGIEALGGVLRTYLKKYPDSFLLNKWLDDSTRAVENAFTDANEPIPIATSDDLQLIATPPSALVVPQQDGQSKKRKRVKRTQQEETSSRPATKKLSDFKDDRFVDVGEKVDKRAGGKKIHPLLVRGTRRCKLVAPLRGEDDLAQIRRRCIGSRECDTFWANSAHGRVFTHLANCDSVPGDIRHDAFEILARKGKARARGLDNSASAKFFSGRRSSSPIVVDMSDEEGSDNEKSSDEEACPAKRQKVFDTPTPALVQGGLEVVLENGRQNFNEQGNWYLLLFLVTSGIAFHAIDSEFLEKFTHHLNKKFTPVSATHLHDTLLPQEALRCRLDMIEFFKGCRNLTISFDGGKIRRPASVYTVHVSTFIPQPRAFMIDLVDTSKVSHTAEYICEFLERIMREIGPFNFSNALSDNCSNVRKARRLTNESMKSVFNTQDPCHTWNNGLKDICSLVEFKEFVADLRQILAFMHESTYTMEQFNSARLRLNLSHGLQSIGNTRFSTLYWSADALEKNLPAMKAIVNDPELGINLSHGHNSLFPQKATPTSIAFEYSLSKFTTVAAPIAKAILVLEAAQCNAAEVYMNCVSAMAHLYKLLTENEIGLSTATISEVCDIASIRFNEIVHGRNCNDLYVVATYLSPEYRDAMICPKDMSRRGEIGRAIQSRVAKALSTMLSNEYGEELISKYGKASAISEKERSNLKIAMKIRNPAFAKYLPLEALSKLRTQYDRFCAGDSPFGRALRGTKACDALSMWLRLLKEEKGDVDVLATLAIKVLSVTVNSMSEERTMSEITWINSARRNRQLVSTVKHQVQVRSWHTWDPEKKSSRVSPQKWRNLKKTPRFTKNPKAPKDQDVLEHDADDTMDGDYDGSTAWSLSPAALSAAVGEHIDLGSPFFLDFLADSDGKSTQSASTTQTALPADSNALMIIPGISFDSFE